MRYPARQRAIAAAVKTARERVGLTRRELSERLKRAHNYIQKVERLQTPVYTADFIQIAIETEMDVQDLVALVTGAAKAKQSKA